MKSVESSWPSFLDGFTLAVAPGAPRRAVQMFIFSLKVFGEVLCH